MTANETRLKLLRQFHYMLINHAKIFKRKLKFDMGLWSDKTKEEILEEGLCGTRACALGSAALYPKFNKLGLHLSLYSTVPTFKGETTAEAGAAFFKIGKDEALWLFVGNYRAERKDDGCGKVKPKDVARRVAVLIDHYKKNPHKRFIGRNGRHWTNENIEFQRAA